MFKFRPTSISALILCCEDYQLPRNEVESGKAGVGRGKEYQIYFDIEPRCEKASKLELSQTELDWINFCLHLKEMIIEKCNNSGFAIYTGTGTGLWLIRFKLGGDPLALEDKRTSGHGCRSKVWLLLLESTKGAKVYHTGWINNAAIADVTSAWCLEVIPSQS